MYSLIDKYKNKKLVYEFIGINPHILKILPIWNKYWKDAEELLYEIGLTQTQIIYGKKKLLESAIFGWLATFYL